MARGDMTVEVTSYSSEVQILHRKEFQAVEQTVNFTSVSGDVVKAGTPISAAGVPITATPWTGAVGLLLHDAYKTHPQVACLTQGYVNKTRAQANSGLTYDTALTTALNAAGCRVYFE